MKIRAKYGGKCNGCQGYVSRGQLCHYNPQGSRGKKVRCSSCGESAYQPVATPLFQPTYIAPPSLPTVVVRPTEIHLPFSTPRKNAGSKAYAGTVVNWVVTAAVVLLIAVASFGGGSSSRYKPSSHNSSKPTNSVSTSRPYVAENGSYFGEPNKNQVPKTVYVNGYYRSDGTYVRGHYRSPPYSNPPYVSPRTNAPSYSRPPPTSSYSGSKPYVAENGSYYGQSNDYGVPKTTHVSGYTRKDGTYVRGHYRSK